MTVRAELPYLSADTPSSLHRTGQLYTQRDADGTDHGFFGVHVDPTTVDINDGRDHPNGSDLDSAAVELVESSVPDVDYLDDHDIRSRHLPACRDLVAAVTGAERVITFDYNVRSSARDRQGRRIQDGQTVQGPARIVHGDYTLDGAPQRLRDLAEEHDLADAVAGRQRWRIVNVWRNRSPRPVVDAPLALCDGASIAPEDLAVFEIRYPHRIGENYFAKVSDAHRWWWFPEVTQDEAILIKQWDSHGAMARSAGRRADRSESGPCTFSLHTAFSPPANRTNRTPEDGVGRESIEVRCLVLG